MVWCRHKNYLLLSMNFLIFFLALSLTLTACQPITTPSPSEPITDSDDQMMADKMIDKTELQAMMAGKQPSQDVMTGEITAGQTQRLAAINFAFRADLEDITNGVDLRGISTEGLATGQVGAQFEEGEYLMRATFENLPRPLGRDFYEGWIVRPTPFAFISTGRVERIDGQYVNTYTSSQDLTPYTRYVLTLEADDGNPAPADHILEGEMTLR